VHDGPECAPTMRCVAVGGNAVVGYGKGGNNLFAVF
jgi:hypothetical protein